MKTFEFLRVAIFVILIMSMVSLSAAELDTREDPFTDPVPKVKSDIPSEPIQKISEDTIPKLYIRYPLTEKERAIVEAVVAAESMGEDFDGQCLVAQCILNTAEATGKRPDEVVLEPGQYATPNYEDSYLVSAAVSAVFDYGYQVTDEPIRYFYAPAWGISKWHETKLDFALEHGGHRFFKEHQQ